MLTAHLKPEELKKVEAKTVEIFAKIEKNLTCTCHWPATGAPCHAPDCEVEQAWETAFEDAVQELYDEGEIS